MLGFSFTYDEVVTSFFLLQALHPHSVDLSRKKYACFLFFFFICFSCLFVRYSLSFYIIVSFRFLLPILVPSLFFICFLFHTFLQRISSFFVSLSFYPIELSVPISAFQLALHYVQFMLKNHTLNSNYLYIFFRILNERYRYSVSL